MIDTYPKIGEIVELGTVVSSDLLTFEKCYLMASSVYEISRLRQAVDATVLISDARDKPQGSGVIVQHNGEKYVVTATHVLGQKAVGQRTNLKIFERRGEDISAINLEELTMLYSTPMAREKNLPVADVGIFSYSGKMQGVELVNPLNHGKHIAVTIGYPAKHQQAWIRDLQPLVSPGNAYIPQKKKRELTPYLIDLLKRNGVSAGPESIEKIIFTGMTHPGNSGGGLFNMEGNLLGVCRGPEGSIGKETGLREFYPVLQIFEALRITQ